MTGGGGAVMILPAGRGPATSVTSGTRNRLDFTCTLTSTDRKSTRLNSSHRCISYAVFCLKKKIRMTNVCELAACLRDELRHTAQYRLNDDAAHRRLLDAPGKPETLETVGRQFFFKFQAVHGHSLPFPQVGSSA